MPEITNEHCTWSGANAVARWHQHQYWSALVYVSRIGCAIIAVGWLLHGGC